MRSPTILIAALLLALALTSRPDAAEDDTAVTDLDGITLGQQVWGPRLSRHDLEGRIVVTYHWCVSCPLSTGSFPYVNQLVAKYARRGVAFVGFQVRRRPEVAPNDVVWYLEHLRPDFPVTRLGWVSEWPAQVLPWAVVFDHTGKRIFAANLRGIEEVLDKALEQAPDPVVGGPYQRLRATAAAIVADRSTTGRHLTAARGLIADVNTALDVREEARAMIVAAERYHARQTAKADEDMEGPIEKAVVHAALAAMFAGDVLGELTQKRLVEMRSSPTWASEETSYRALTAAQTAFRRLPPPGQYIYHFTDMNYRVSDSVPLRERRSRMIAEFRLDLERIVEQHPDSHAAGVASDLLFEHDVPEMDEDEATGRVARAAKLIARGRAYDLREARLLLVEVVEGYLATDDTSKKADRLLKEVTEGRAKDLALAATLHATLEAEVAAIENRIRLGGSVLPRASAEAFFDELEAVAAQAGPSSELARRIAESIVALRSSYDGPPQLGVAFDQGHEGPGVKIARIYPRTAAEAAGIRPGDVILRFGDVEVDGVKGLTDAIESRKPGDEVQVVLRRDGKDVTVEVTLGRRL